jgi:hypothetical protein
MDTPQQKVKVFYFGKPALRFKHQMDEYRKKHNLSDIYAPKIVVSEGGRTGKHTYSDVYTVTYYEYSARQLRPELPIHKVIVRAKGVRPAQETFYKLTKDNPDVTFVRAIKKDRVPGTDLYEFVVEWRKAIYRKHKSKKRD